MENLSVYTAKHQYKDQRKETKWKLNRRNLHTLRMLGLMVY